MAPRTSLDHDVRSSPRIQQFASRFPKARSRRSRYHLHQGDDLWRVATGEKERGRCGSCLLARKGMVIFLNPFTGGGGLWFTFFHNYDFEARSKCHHLVNKTFLDALSHLYKRVCPSVRRSVRRSVRHTRVEFPRNGPNSNKIASGISKYAIWKTIQ